MRYKVQVNTHGDPAGVFTGNNVQYSTQERAVEEAKSLFDRWLAVKNWRVINTDNEVVADNL